MHNLSQRSVLVMDFRNFFEVAQVLARSFGTVYYYCPSNINGFPEHEPIDVGRNVNNVIRVKEYETVLSNIDMAFFCDCFDPEKQKYFEDIGIPVFGGKGGVEMETNRGLFKKILKRLDLPVTEYDEVKGIDALSDALKNKNNVYVKSNLRGDMETWKHKDYRLSKYKIDKMRSELNVFQTEPDYLLDSHIDSIGEIGRDQFVVNGRYPEIVMAGVECKNSCYIAKLIHYLELPKQLRLISDRLSEIFLEYNYKGFYSDEVLIGQDRRGYICDITTRMPAPPTSLLTEMISNFSECVWDVAHGIVPTLKYTSTWGVELIIKADNAETDPIPIIVPKEFQDKVKIKNLVIDNDGTWVYTPSGIFEAKEIGSVVGHSTMLSHAIQMAEEVANSIQGIDISIDTNIISTAKKCIQDVNMAGIKFLM